MTRTRRSAEWRCVRGAAPSALVTRLAEVVAAGLLRPSKALVRRSSMFLGALHYALDETGTTPAAVLAHGGTVALNESERSLRPLGVFSRQLVEAARTEGTINCYLTAPATPGAATHVDDHDVIALQVSGAKRWRLGSRSVTLRAGDVLFVPRGCGHSTLSVGDTTSIHLAINGAHALSDTGDVFVGRLLAALGSLPTSPR